jgi:hypothetical protein
MHLGGNMLYLWIFGDNLEHRMGHVRFLVFYLLCGLAAGGAHIVFNSASNVPTVGASGAISGVLGGYLLLFPKNRVRVLTRGGVMGVPAMYVLGFWIFIQFINSAGSMANTSETGDSGGVAYLAHVGGFVAGLALVKLFAILSVKLALMGDSRLFHYEIEVEDDEQTITLSGRVSTEEEKAAARDVAQKVLGVKDVVNKLTVEKDLAKILLKKQDDALTSLIKERFSKSATLKAANIEV